jgi:hypothetical protein
MDELPELSILFCNLLIFFASEINQGEKEWKISKESGLVASHITGHLGISIIY